MDPTKANNGGFNTFSVKLKPGGLRFGSEESESWTVGFAYEQNFTNKFKLSLASRTMK